MSNKTPPGGVKATDAMTHWKILTVLVLSWCVAAGAEDAKERGAVRRTVFYTGHVQGVGFRATTQEIARGFKVTGWVKNLEDGRVQMVVEGGEAEVTKFADAVVKRFEKNITKQEAETGKTTGEFSSFEIRR